MVWKKPEAEAIEEDLGSPVKLRILRLMARSPGYAFTKYELERRIGAKPVGLRAHLSDLGRLGWVKELPYRPRRYEINLENEIVRSLVAFFREVGYI